MRLKLKIEPRPVSTWGVTLANRLPRREWDDLRQEVYRRANYTCEICGTNTSRLHAHEVWAFDDRGRIQRLAGFQCLCELCHDVKHFGRSSQVYPPDYLEKLVKHWCKVNKKSVEDFWRHEAEIRQLNRRRADKAYIVKVGRRILT